MRRHEAPVLCARDAAANSDCGGRGEYDATKYRRGFPRRRGGPERGGTQQTPWFPPRAPPSWLPAGPGGRLRMAARRSRGPYEARSGRGKCERSRLSAPAARDDRETPPVPCWQSGPRGPANGRGEQLDTPEINAATFRRPPRRERLLESRQSCAT